MGALGVEEAFIIPRSLDLQRESSSVLRNMSNGSAKEAASPSILGSSIHRSKVKQKLASSTGRPHCQNYSAMQLYSQRRFLRSIFPFGEGLRNKPSY
ncbi:unnamed protein product [Caretta caretta]